jgi:acetyltransferase-like isoleucine patch superfamily enzyme
MFLKMRKMKFENLDNRMFGIKNYVLSSLRSLAYKSKLRQSPYIDRVVLLDGKKVSVGKFTYGFESTKIFRWDENCEISIGRYCSIAYGLKLFCGGNHNKSLVTTFPFGRIFTEFYKYHSDSILLTNGSIVIGNDVWIGRDVTIMSGITIGNGAVIAANSHVVTNVEPYSVYGGNPARLIKHRFSHEIIDILQRIKWWEFDNKVVAEYISILLSEPTMTDLMSFESKLKSSI